jgi:hypothetical protein
MFVTIGQICPFSGRSRYSAISKLATAVILEQTNLSEPFLVKMPR